MTIETTARRRCVRCRRWFRFVRSTKTHCSVQCRNADAQAAKRGREAIQKVAMVPMATRARCPICGRWFWVTVRRGGTPARYDRAECKRIAEKIALLSDDAGTAPYR